MAGLSRGELFERDTELAELARLSRAAKSGAGAVAIVEGPAGIGKTSLLNAAREDGERGGMCALAAHGSELERGFAYGVVRQLFEPALAAIGPDHRRRLFSGAAGLAQAVLVDPSTAGQPPSGDPSFATLHGLYWLTFNLAQERPLLLLVDDAHWLDPASLRFVVFLSNRIEGLPALLALAVRTAESDAPAGALEELATRLATATLRPAPLSRSAVGRVLGAELETEPDLAFVAACDELSGGNPFLIRELAVALAAEGIEPSAARVEELRSFTPAVLSRSVLLRLSRLSAPAPQLARAVAVLGDGAGLRHAAALAGLDIEEAREAADVLTRLQIFGVDPALGFTHPLVRAAVYEDLPPATRAGEHERAATVLMEHGAAATRVVVHLLEVEASGDAQVVRVLRRAACEARSVGAPDVAVSYLRRALAEGSEPSAQPDLLLELGQAEKDAGDPAALEHLRQAAELLEDPDQLALVALDFSRRAMVAPGMAEEGLELLERAITRRNGDDLELRLQAQFVAAALTTLPTQHLAVARLDKLDSSHRADGLGARELLAVRGFHGALAGMTARDAADLAERSLDVGPSLRAALLNTPPYHRAIRTLIAADRLGPAERSLELALSEAQQRGSVAGLAVATALRSSLFFVKGDVRRAEAEARTALEATEAVRWLPLPYVAAYLADALIERGELEEAETVLGSAGLRSADEPALARATALICTRARLRLAEHRAQDALRELNRAIEAKERSGTSEFRDYPWTPFPARVLAALALAALEQPDRARRLLDAEERLARDWGTPRAIGTVLRARGLVESGERSVELLEQAVAVLEASSAQLELARALTDLGAALRRRNRRTDARQILRRAQELAHQCGAAALEERARLEISATGARARRITETGLDSLTASELRVVQLAADGLSNPEIAQALFVTVNTVETHLRHAYRKLDISSRRELPRALDTG